MSFDINPNAAVPIYRQIVDQVRRRVAGGLLKPGDEMPSVRAVAAAQAVNPMTVSKAYSLLEAEGVLARQRGVGMVVAEQRAKGLAKRLALLQPSIEAAARHARELEIPADEVVALMRQFLDGDTR